MENKNKPAFALTGADGVPFSENDEHIIKGNGILFGLTKLEYFTAMAMQGLLSRLPTGAYNSKSLASTSVEIATETLTQLNQTI